MNHFQGADDGESSGDAPHILAVLRLDQPLDQDVKALSTLPTCVPVQKSLETMASRNRELDGQRALGGRGERFRCIHRVAEEANGVRRRRSSTFWQGLGRRTENDEGCEGRQEPSRSGYRGQEDRDSGQSPPRLVGSGVVPTFLTIVLMARERPTGSAFQVRGDCGFYTVEARGQGTPLPLQCGPWREPHGFRLPAGEYLDEFTLDQVKPETNAFVPVPQLGA